MDDTVMRVAEVFMALPWIYLLLAAHAFLCLYAGPRESFFLLVGVIGPTGRARRRVILSPKEGDFVRAALGFSASNAYTSCHLLPETNAVVLTQAAILTPQRILAELTLSFVGLGVGEPVPHLGECAGQVRRSVLVGAKTSLAGVKPPVNEE